MIKSMLLAGIGGFIGTCFRFLTGKFCSLITDSPFPYGTLAVNLAGSFIIGILFGLAERSNIISPQMNILLITGFCGGFTTFSSLADDMFIMLQQHRFLSFWLYAAASFMLGLLLVWAGRSAAKLI
ncbi:MAG: fluoride efflux transporter CrcB [Alistipes sp.]|nr:fluoride efflux transporter CrcB [Alistipes sp.]